MATDECFNYLPIRDCDVKWGLYVTGAGSVNAGPHAAYPSRRHPAPYQFTWAKGRVLPEYQVVYILRGEGVFESGATGVKRIQAGSVILTFPGVWHRYHPSESTGWQEYWFGLNGEHLHGLIGQGIFAPKDAVLEIGDRTEIEGECRALVDRVRLEPHRGHTIAAAALQVLATVLEVAVVPTPAPVLMPRAVEDAVVAKAIQYIWNHSERPINVVDVVAQFPVARRSLERRFRDALNTTILDEIVNCRLQRAKQLLSETNLPVGQVATMSGFSRTQHMNEAFQRREGISAWAYRRDCRQVGAATAGQAGSDVLTLQPTPVGRTRVSPGA
jgi:AraC-like DNA-binding protein